jgi:hypothetical protein
MKMLALVSFAAFAFGVMGAAEPLSTDRHVHGVITSIDPAVITIASTQRAVTGKIDPLRTKVTVNGKPGKLADLKITAHAKAELCLDDVWIAIDTH